MGLYKVQLGRLLDINANYLPVQHIVEGKVELAWPASRLSKSDMHTGMKYWQLCAAARPTRAHAYYTWSEFIGVYFCGSEICCNKGDAATDARCCSRTVYMS